MFIVFRQIRKSLTESGSVRKYLIYTLGEILLIVLGILIALQINNWNEDRKDRIKEIKLLNDLTENIIFNINSIENIISDFKEEDNSSDLIISLIQNRLNYNDTLDYHFARALNTRPRYVISSVGYESLKNTGFDIIQDDLLKKEVINLFELTYNTVLLRQDNLPDMWEFISARFMRYPTTRRYKPLDFEKLLEDSEFLSMVNGLKGNRLWIIRGYEEALSASQRLLQLSKNELESTDNL